MDLDTYTARLRDDLRAAAALGDERTQQIADALSTAAATSARLMLLNALSDFAASVNESLEHVSVHVESDGTHVRADVRAKDEYTESPGHPSFEEMTGDISRVTLRLVEQIKARAEEAAAQSGQSLNAWLSNVVQGALRDQMWRGGNNRYY
ncbi:hypothetical protein FOS14_17175 [Skermania sp. ID1734]|uniref:hypothetical protein n=1 Tax=Skermania sp. ID1734 TaxID=2597516 RepID=UPI00117EB46E|nr:hypothetical protein [Skermania sp. ID1734]TSD96088.1 hypothetical protein FOS14_17175 [Skermania sp. ID1734]